MSESLSLFPDINASKQALKREHAPLADRIRPQDWEAVKGLSNIDQALLKQLQAGKGVPPSLVFWGPPGCGKTTFAKLVGESFDCNFVEFSAVLGGVKEVRAIVAAASRSSKPTILFVDEIHRFNKAQQDAFLPHVERGTIILLGATTENPSFSLNAALLSRMRVVVLKELGASELKEILLNAAKELEVSLPEDAAELLANYAGGDARRGLNALESFVDANKAKKLNKEKLAKYLKEATALRYNKAGEEHYNMISAFIKSMRGSDPDAALFWGFRMIESGEDPRFIIRRMMIFASEDIGNADPRALSIATTTSNAFERLGMPEGKIPIAQCITYLATAPKSNRSYQAMNEVLQAVRDNPKITVPMHLRNAPTKLMKDLGYSEGYQYPHSFDEGYVEGVNYLPEEIGDKKFYKPTDRGYEKRIKEMMKK